jgi:inositol hexakisphosphate/diphosphoinositol-pentakisphosphate kinase
MRGSDSEPVLGGGERTNQEEMAEVVPPMTVVVGICAMEKKTSSKPMKTIISRLEAFRCAGDGEHPEFEVVVFPNETILHAPIEEWPLCDCLCSWFSDGFPLDKAIAYARLRRPFLVNDLEKQKDLMDRRTVYALLTANGVPVSDHVIMSREEGSTDVFVEDEDWIEVNGVRINKPFVEKPFDAEDHNVYIYFPMSAGGGSKRLYRKVSDRSSTFYPDHNSVRTEGSYIYEVFLRTEGTDIKVCDPQCAPACSHKKCMCRELSPRQPLRYTPSVLDTGTRRHANLPCWMDA